MNETLKKILELQAIDQEADRLAQKTAEIPRRIAEMRARIQAGKAAEEQEKGRLISIQVKRKEKEVELASQEEKIRKHEAELNSVKSNDAYKALLSEIAAARDVKGRIEEEILTLMEEADNASRESRRLAQDAQAEEKDLHSKIQGLEAEQNKEQEALAAENRRRAEFAGRLPADLLSRYDAIRGKKKGSVLVAITGESCGGCNTTLTPSTINEVKKGKDLVLCESCARILYIPETAAPAAAGAAGQ